VIGLLQRVSQSSVRVNGNLIAEIDQGLLALIGIERGDAEAQADRLLERLLGYRVFEDQQGKMNLSVAEKSAGLLLVPQFTLAADTQKGMRPSFTPAAVPAEAERLFDYLCQAARQQHENVGAGKFGANMQVALINEGPVTFYLRV